MARIEPGMMVELSERLDSTVEGASGRRRNSMIYITARHMAGGTRHEHIASVRWRNPSDGNTGQSTRADMVKWIDGGGEARVRDGNDDVMVGVVKATPPYIRTYADGKWKDNLLALPEF
jgi:hypothetical protein